MYRLYGSRSCRRRSGLCRGCARCFPVRDYFMRELIKTHRPFVNNCAWIDLNGMLYTGYDACGTAT